MRYMLPNNCKHALMCKIGDPLKVHYVVLGKKM